MTGISDKRMEQINLVNEVMNALPGVREEIIAKAKELVNKVEHNHSETKMLLKEIAELNKKLTKMDKIADRGF
jgi:uncharacterized coiled-coil DUF342 family protein